MLTSIAHCYSQGVTYTDRSAFNAALLSNTTVAFETLTPSSYFDIGVSPIIVSGLTVTNYEHRLFNPASSLGDIHPIPGDGQYLWNFDSSYPVGIFLPNGMTAFGADFSGGIDPNAAFNATLTVNLLGGQSYAYNFSGPSGSWTFFGVTFSQPISNLVYHDGGRIYRALTRKCWTTSHLEQPPHRNRTLSCLLLVPRSSGSFRAVAIPANTLAVNGSERV